MLHSLRQERQSPAGWTEASKRTEGRKNRPLLCRFPRSPRTPSARFPRADPGGRREPRRSGRSWISSSWREAVFRSGLETKPRRWGGRRGQAGVKAERGERTSPFPRLRSRYRPKPRADKGSYLGSAKQVHSGGSSTLTCAKHPEAGNFPRTRLWISLFGISRCGNLASCGRGNYLSWIRESCEPSQGALINHTLAWREHSP